MKGFLIKLSLLFFIIILTQNFNLILDKNIISVEENLLVEQINSGYIWPFSQGPNVPYEIYPTQLVLNTYPSRGHNFQANVTIKFMQKVCKYSLNYQVWLEQKLVSHSYSQIYNHCYNSGSNGKWPGLISLTSEFPPGKYKFNMYIFDENSNKKALDIYYYSNVQ